MSEDVPWETVTLGLGVAVVRARDPQEPHRRRLDLGELRVRRRRRRRWPLGTYLVWAETRSDGTPFPKRKRREVRLNRLTSRTRSSPGPS